MCCFSQPVVSVKGTKIFCRRTSGGSQFLAYQMDYESAGENAMILPVPVRQAAGEGGLRFIDLQGYEGFFDDLSEGFPYEAPVRLGCAMYEDSLAAGALAVFEVGSFVASFVPSVADFSRLDPRFRLPESTWAKMPGYGEFGFAVFQLKAGAVKPHPMAFEFDSAEDAVFFPTLHIHDGEIHEEEEFDHVLYLQHAGFDSRVYGYENWNVRDRSTGWVRSKWSASEFSDVGRSAGLVAGDLLVHRTVIRGMQANQDTLVAIDGDPERRGLNLRPMVPMAPWVVAAAGLGWFLVRRMRLLGRRG